MKFIRNVYEGFTGLADKAYARWVLGATAFAEAVFFPLPPDTLLVPMCLGNPAKAFRFALICSVFSVLGACAGFFLGKFLWGFIHEWFFMYVFNEANFNEVGEQFNRNAFLTIAVSAFTPIPFKVFTVASGVFDVGFGALVAGSAVGRSARFFLLAGLLWKFGENVKPFIDRHLNMLTLAAVVLAALAVIFLK